MSEYNIAHGVGVLDMVPAKTTSIVMSAPLVMSAQLVPLVVVVHGIARAPGSSDANLDGVDSATASNPMHKC